ncbi:MAG: hypothetical protein ABFE08_17770 [Armatimonadia bacterium]
MAVSLKHKFASAKADGADPSLVKPSNWNDEHDLTLATDTLLGRATAGAGAVEEVACTAAGRALLDDATAADQRTTLGLGTASNPQFASIELGNASDTTLTRASGGTVAVEGVNLAKITDVTGQQTIWVPAGAMTSRTTNGAASGSIETTTNKVMLRTLDFDTAVEEYAQFAVQMPKSWDAGTLICQFIWSHAATTTNFGVVWGIQAMSLGDGGAADTAFGTPIYVSDTGGTTNNIYITAETTAVTVGSTPTAENLVVFQVSRSPTSGSDTLAADARLHGVKVHYTTNAAKDD